MMRTRDGRLNLRIDPELAKSIKEYASSHHTTVTEIIVRHFLDVLEQEKTERKLVDAEQI